MRDWKNSEFRLYALKRNSFRSQRKYCDHILARLSLDYFWLVPNDGGEKDVEQKELATKPFLISSVWSIVLEGSFCRVAINSCAGCGLE
jgi:hypothetical protein